MSCCTGERGTNPSLLLSALGTGVGTLWNTAAWLRVKAHQAGLLPKQRLRAKVISVGNLAWGGTGKTPFTIWLAVRLQDAGLRVSILTRGYGRRSRERVQIIPPGTRAEDVPDAGDEVRLYLRHLRVPIGIAASRHLAGSQVENRFPVDVHLLDDGFQHLSLHRNLDLVLVDALNPWSTLWLVPGVLREGRSALRRADAVLVTRSELLPPMTRDYAGGIRATVKKHNSDAPCFMVRTMLLPFTNSEGCAVAPEEFRSRRPLAFCAVGNPRAFFRMLAMEGIPVAGQKAFPDHFRYSMSNLVSLEKAAAEAGADCLLTTEKDLINLPANANFRLPLYWAAIQLSVEEEPRLLQWIWDRLELPGAPPELRPEEARNSQAQFATEGRAGRRGFDKLTTG